MIRLCGCDSKREMNSDVWNDYYYTHTHTHTTFVEILLEAIIYIYIYIGHIILGLGSYNNII